MIIAGSRTCNQSLIFSYIKLWVTTVRGEILEEYWKIYQWDIKLGERGNALEVQNIFCLKSYIEGNTIESISEGSPTNFALSSPNWPSWRRWILCPSRVSFKIYSQPLKHPLLPFYRSCWKLLSKIPLKWCLASVQPFSSIYFI